MERIYRIAVISCRSLIFVSLGIFLLSCVPSMFQAKISEDTRKVDETGSTLIKPKLVQSSESQKLSGSKEIPKSDGGNLPTRDMKSKVELIPKPQGRPDTQESLSPKTLSESSDKDITSKRLVGREKGTVPPESYQIRGEKPSDVRSNAPESDDWDKSEASAPTFKKHNHQDYVTRIRNLAIDEVNKEPNAIHATICNDSTTDDWILTIYFRPNKTFSYKSFVWDSIDDKWNREYESERISLNMWKKHLTFASAGKKCKVLKGTGDK